MVGSSAGDSLKNFGSRSGVGDRVGPGRVEDVHRLLQVPVDSSQDGMVSNEGLEELEVRLYAVAAQDGKRLECSPGLRRHPLLS